MIEKAYSFEGKFSDTYGIHILLIFIFMLPRLRTIEYRLHHTQTHTHTRMLTDTHIRTHIYIHTHTHPHIRTLTHTHTHFLDMSKLNLRHTLSH